MDWDAEVMEGVGCGVWEQGEMQQVREKLACAERACKSEAQAKVGAVGEWVGEGGVCGGGREGGRRLMVVVW